MDLFTRKLFKDKGQTLNALNALIEHMSTLIEKTRTQNQAKVMGRRFSILVNRFSEIWARMKNQSDGEDFRNGFAYAPPFMKIMGEVCLGWMLLWRASAAETSLLEKNIEKPDQDFYNSQIRTARYFFQTLMPVTQSRMEAWERFPSVISEIGESDFDTI